MGELTPKGGSQRLLRLGVSLLLSITTVIGATAAWLALDAGVQSGPIAAEMSSAAPKDEFERRVRDYLLAHPEVIGEALVDESRFGAADQPAARAEHA